MHLQKVLPHAGLPCIHAARLIDHLDYIFSGFTTWGTKIIYNTKIANFSDELLKGIPLSKHVGPLLPAKYMWKTGSEEKNILKKLKQGKKKVVKTNSQFSMKKNKQNEEVIAEISCMDNNNNSGESDTCVNKTTNKFKYK